MTNETARLLRRVRGFYILILMMATVVRMHLTKVEMAVPLIFGFQIAGADYGMKAVEQGSGGADSIYQKFSHENRSAIAHGATRNSQRSHSNYMRVASAPNFNNAN